MKKIIYVSLALAMSLPAMAQETYENANIATEDLNGTARYVGMGGAMEALGADISTMSTNPAGIGLFRRSTASVSAGFMSQQDAKEFNFGKTSHVSFDQIGFVYSMKSGRKSFMNIGFNYHKSRDFNYILNTVGRLNGASQNKLSFLKQADEVFYPQGSLDNGINGLDAKGGDAPTYSQIDYLYYNAMLTREIKEGGKTVLDFNPYDATGFMMDRANKGYIGEYDFNMSGNINDRVYLGVTIGYYDVHYKNYSEYAERIGNGNVIIGDEREITGTGFDVKVGAIFRPIEYSPFRIGVFFATPKFYDLKTANYTTLTNNTPYGAYDNGKSSEAYDFKFNTPWRFGVSLGHTVGDYLALGASYEYADYSSLDNRIIDGDGYDWWYDSYYESSSSDREMNDNSEYSLKGVSTLKLGLEYKPVPELAIRLGYNYVSPMYSSNGFKNGTLWSPGSYYASTTDYTNWKTTNRFTCGLGYQAGNMSIDVAYQYSAQDGDFHPFMEYSGSSKTFTNSVTGETMSFNNIPEVSSVSNKRHQFLMTLGYRF
ncbi:MAG: hemin receptor [Prevotella sp.]|uniref:OmpP1/FadL family transporter n=1 Tax=Prevotella sp. TaxID=59823 RepID=UPI002A267137|nr:hemin receptor [Prevotella sp.]MDD7318120.1 hemin receptor [Prevotellaceae bacterium]MDY4020991.1 hemin receptor [Prevotella sp.]